MRGAVRSMLRPVSREVHALRGIDLSVTRGEIVAYAGPNGAGKSTTIKLLSGILGPDAGSVTVFGRDPLADRRAHVANIGVVFGQRTELWHDHPVAATFEWKRVVWDVPEDRYRRMLGALTELLDLAELLPALARELSLGQRMRAELALALLHEPELLLLDEPTIGLDVLGKRRVLSFVKELKSLRDVTVLVTSHDMADLEQLAERVVMVHRGRVAFDGDFRQLRRSVTSRRLLLLETQSASAPYLPHAELVESAAGRHSYLYDPSIVDVSTLLGAASAVTEVLDVETHRPDIDDVVADLYEHWRRA
ncbi:MAG TPA: ATP-binding cassette domain-containing protein [Acidimicrobiales bacterium]|nr:ATP-binding cassette domain-containing protein [Acidimicrobiales bacterium]